MIETIGEQVQMQFGTGGIGFNAGAYNEDDKKVGVVVFYNQSPREIGSAADIKAGTGVDMNAFPVIMTFHKKESIDVLIQSLLDVKKEMG